MNECKTSHFQVAIEEAYLAEQGFTEKLIQDINMAAGNPTYDDSVLRCGQEATGSNQDQECHSPNQACFHSYDFYFHFLFVCREVCFLGNL